MATGGRPRHDRVRAIRFALWARTQDPHQLTPQRISGLLGVTLNTARNWRADWFTAVSPTHVEGVTDLLCPPPLANTHTQGGIR